MSFVPHCHIFWLFCGISCIWVKIWVYAYIAQSRFGVTDIKQHFSFICCLCLKTSIFFLTAQTHSTSPTQSVNCSAAPRKGQSGTVLSHELICLEGRAIYFGCPGGSKRIKMEAFLPLEDLLGYSRPDLVGRGEFSFSASPHTIAA